MTVQSSLDPVRIVEEFFYRLFHSLFHDEGARKYFELSQINFFNSSDEGLPGWNLWLQQNTKVYQLSLVEAYTTHGEDQFSNTADPYAAMIKGRLVIKYFPATDDPLLDTYSCAETLLRTGPLFDHTGTPGIRAQECIDASCFVVGYLDFRTSTDRNFIELTCVAPNRWKDIRVDGLYLQNPRKEEVEAVSPGGIDRNVPGWDLSFFIFDKLVSSCGYVFKTAPWAAAFAHKKWFRFNIDKNHCSKTEMDDDIELFHLVAGFTTNTDNDENHSSLLNRKTYSRMINDRLTADGFLISEMCIHPCSQLSHQMIPSSWWSTMNLLFSAEAGAEMHHCCYHDH